MTESELQRLRDLPTLEVARRLGMEISHRKAICPFHNDKHPSLTFPTKHNGYRCYACGAAGDNISLVMHVLHLGFVDACRWISDTNSIILTPNEPRAVRAEPKPAQLDLICLNRLVEVPFLTDEAKHFLFEERKIHPAVVRWLGLSSIRESAAMSRKPHASRFNGPSLLIPYRDQEGRLLTVQARYLGQPDQGAKRHLRFQFPYGSPVVIYNQPVLKLLKPGEPLWCAEGPSDTFALLSSGRKAIGIPSATALRPEHEMMLADVVKRLGGLQIHIFPDHDDAGELLFQALLTMANRIGACLVRHDLPAGYKDFGQCWAAGVNC